MDQMILPTEVVKRVEKLSKELAAVKREIRKALKIPRSQAWFWSQKWQRKEKEADKDFKEGRVKTFSSMGAFIKDLHK